MSNLSRLSVLLRSFRLPADASSSDLKEAYLREAKRLHPDLKPASHHTTATREFMELQKRFEETAALFEKVGAASASAASMKRPSTQPDYYAWSEQFSQGNAQPEGVPTVGLPSQLVYVVACSVLSVGIAAWFWRIAKHEEKFTSQNSKMIASAPEMSLKALDSAASINDNGSRDASSYYNALSRFRRTKSKPPVRGRFEAQLRDGLALAATHVAAQDGCIWAIERCAASGSCRQALNIADRRGDTPLHHCVNAGEVEACRTLLRVGADPQRENRWHLRPEDLAVHKGHERITNLLQAHRIAVDGSTGQAARMDIRRHADGLGVITCVPEGMYYIGPYHSAALRNAVNYAAGQLVVVDLDLSGPSGEELQQDAMSDAATGIEFALGRVRAALDGSPFELSEGTVGKDDVQFLLQGDCAYRCDGTVVVGLLVFEPPCAVSPDAPGHWVAVKLWPGIKAFYRLDTVRGTYRLTDAEFSELTSRYPCWQVLHRQASTGPLFFSRA